MEIDELVGVSGQPVKVGAVEKRPVVVVVAFMHFSEAGVPQFPGSLGTVSEQDAVEGK